jgi:hypothetical protein
MGGGRVLGLGFVPRACAEGGTFWAMFRPACPLSWNTVGTARPLQ